MKNDGNYIKTSHGNVWYKTLGQGNGTPLIVVHGGPGATHYYLEPLEDLGAYREVIFYDQIGGGQSDKLDKSLWKPETFVKELGEIVESLGLKQYHLLGQSWGAAVVASFALTQPEGLKRIILADSYLSTPRWDEDADRLIKKLSKKTQETLHRGELGTDEYKKAERGYHKRFINMMENRPEAFERNSRGFARDIYNYMWGPYEHLINGTLSDFDLIPDLHKINQPVLLVSGRNDEATPEANEYYASLIPNAKTAVLENSAHFPFWTDREEFMEIVEDFLEESESKPFR